MAPSVVAPLEEVVPEVAGNSEKRTTFIIHKYPNNMKKGTIIILGIVAVLALWCMNAYNGMVSIQEEATNAAANVQSAYQRRADLIPNLVETVKGYATHEENTFKEKNFFKGEKRIVDVKNVSKNMSPYIFFW